MRRQDVPPPPLQHRRLVAGEEPLHVQAREALYRPLQEGEIAAGEIVPPERAVGEDRVPREEDPLPRVVEADPARGVAGGVQNFEPLHGVPLLHGEVGGRPGRAGPEEHRHAAAVVRKSRCIQGVNADPCAAHAADLVHVGGMIVVAVGEDDHADLLPVERDVHREHPGVHQDRAEQVGVSEPAAPGDPSDWHVP